MDWTRHHTNSTMPAHPAMGCAFLKHTTAMAAMRSSLVCMFISRTDHDTALSAIHWTIFWIEGKVWSVNDLMKLYGNEKVGCVPWAKVESFLNRDGLTPVLDMTDDTLCKLGNAIDSNLVEKFHFVAEGDPSSCQIIPFLLIEDASTGEYLVSQRMDQREKFIRPYRLGFDTHVQQGEDIVAAKARLIKDAVGVTDADVFFEDVSGFITDKQSVLGQTHMGIVFRIEIYNKNKVELNESYKGAWLSPSEIASIYRNGRLDAWSEMVFQKEILETLQTSRLAHTMMEAASQSFGGKGAMISIHIGGSSHEEACHIGC